MDLSLNLLKEKLNKNPRIITVTAIFSILYLFFITLDVGCWMMGVSATKPNINFYLFII